MNKLPILVSIPHASTFVPKEMADKMLITSRDIKDHADLFTDEIFDLNCTHKVKAGISRLVVDVNRAPDDIEIESQLCVDGVVVRVTPDGKQIYSTPPSVKGIAARIETYHFSLHDRIEEIVKKEGIKFLIDGHSMWSYRPSALKGSKVNRADICLGNRSFTSCSREQTHFVKHFFEKRGYSVAVNDPYSGKYVLGFHCHRRNLPGIQVEINRSLFLNEKTLAPKKKKIEQLNLEMKELAYEIYEQFLK
ncbi:MAG: N-formylglutamate amidohydrolase [Candidatus Peregrinibacteria bacterium]|nr:N-formylglutamate amidohydrolase [Candidatus Peregrinibacteria bacterium]